MIKFLKNELPKDDENASHIQCGEDIGKNGFKWKNIYV